MMNAKHRAILTLHLVGTRQHIEQCKTCQTSEDPCEIEAARGPEWVKVTKAAIEDGVTVQDIMMLTFQVMS